MRLKVTSVQCVFVQRSEIAAVVDALKVRIPREWARAFGARETSLPREAAGGTRARQPTVRHGVFQCMQGETKGNELSTDAVKALLPISKKAAFLTANPPQKLSVYALRTTTVSSLWAFANW